MRVILYRLGFHLKRLLIRLTTSPPFAGRASFASRTSLELTAKYMYVTVLYIMHSSQSVQRMHHFQGHWFWKERIEPLDNASIHILVRSRLSSKWRIRAMGEYLRTCNYLAYFQMSQLVHNSRCSEFHHQTFVTNYIRIDRTTTLVSNISRRRESQPKVLLRGGRLWIGLA